MDELKKIDLLKERFNVSYAAAKEVLDKAEGDVIAALIDLEQKKEWWKWSHGEHYQNFWTGMKKSFQESYSAKIKIKKNGSTVLKIPLSLGVVGILGALSNRDLALVAGITSLGAMLKGYHLELEGREGPEEDEFIFIS